MNLTDPSYVAGLKSNIHATFESAHGKEVMSFIERLGSWYPTILDSNDTNSIIARDANRRLVGTLKTIMLLTTDQIVELASKES